MYPLCTCMHVSNVSRHAHIPRMEKNALHAKERTEGEIKKLEQEIKVSQALASDRFLRPCVRAPSHHHANIKQMAEGAKRDIDAKLVPLEQRVADYEVRFAVCTSRLLALWLEGGQTFPHILCFILVLGARLTAGRCSVCMLTGGDDAGPRKGASAKGIHRRAKKATRGGEDPSGATLHARAGGPPR